MKLLLSIILGVCLFLYQDTVASAQLLAGYDFLEAEDNGEVLVRLDNALFPLEFDLNEVELQRTETDNSVEIAIKDIESGKILEILGEYSMPSLKRNFSTVTVFREAVTGPTTARFQTTLEVWGSGSFRQIERVLPGATQWRTMTGGDWNLSETWHNVRSTTGRFPAARVQIQGNATKVVRTTTDRATGAWTSSNLRRVGFNMARNGNNYTGRRPISFNFQWGV